ncbi:MAG: sigma-54 interaction domain-containing protein [Anaerovoracaceae bacterium]
MFDKKALDMLEDVLESIPYSIIVDKDYKIVFFSENYAQKVGIDSSLFLGKDVREVIKNTRLDKVIDSGQSESAESFFSDYSIGSTISIFPEGTTLPIVNRIPIWKNGEKNSEILGAFAHTVLSNDAEYKKMLSQLSHLRKEKAMYMNAVNEIYKVTGSLQKLVGTSLAMANLRNNIAKIANNNITISVIGETGTGKEMVTSAIHELSERNDKPFIKINCAAIPESLFESELFGYEPGAFTGAQKHGKVGKFELANKGTILLDEVAEMPLSMQAKLLRVLQEKEIERIGGTHTIPIDVRVICSTNRDLLTEVHKGTFRQDLYYRLNVIVIEVPPLRERLSDIPELCHHFINKFNRNALRPIAAIDDSVFELFKNYSWPGNVRELEHVIECACVIAKTDILTSEDFSFLKKKAKNNSVSSDNTHSDSFTTAEIPLASAPAQMPTIIKKHSSEERDMILAVLKTVRYNKSKAAEKLGMSRCTLYRRMKEFGLDNDTI